MPITDLEITRSLDERPGEWTELRGTYASVMKHEVSGIRLQPEPRPMGYQTEVTHPVSVRFSVFGRWRVNRAIRRWKAWKVAQLLSGRGTEKA